VPPNSAPNAPLPIDGVIADLASLYRTISTANEAGSPLQTGGAEASAASRIQAGASRLPAPVQGWVLGVSRTSAAMSIGGAKDRLLALWRQGPGPACQAATKDRYPFAADAAQDVGLGEFTRLFGPGGTLDSFFNDNLRPYADTGAHPWRWRSTGNLDYGLGDAPLRQFEAAAEIRRSYFAGALPNIGFTLTPLSLEGSARTVSLVSDSQTISYAGQSTSPVRFQWPGLAGSSGAAVTFAAASGQAVGGLEARGPWAWFHLLDQAQERRPGAAGAFSFGFAAVGNRATFLLRPEDSATPFTGALVHAFRCPWAS
jgi:type VI secretion system protein ImpL